MPVLAVLLCLVFAVPVLGAESWVNNVVEVVDGDTIVVMHDAAPQTIRLYGVDCPEEEQKYWNEAKAYTTIQVLNKMVTVEPVTKDASGKTLARVSQAGKNINRMIVEAGLGWVTPAGRSDAKMAAMENEARSSHRGLWSQENPVAPWDYRKKPGKASQEEIVYVTKADNTYHRAGCKLLRSDVIMTLAARPMPLSEARKHYEPCPVCRPPL